MQQMLRNLLMMTLSLVQSVMGSVCAGGPGITVLLTPVAEITLI